MSRTLRENERNYSIIMRKHNKTGKEEFLRNFGLYGRDKEKRLRVADEVWEENFCPVMLHTDEYLRDVLDGLIKYSSKDYFYSVKRVLNYETYVIIDEEEEL